MELLEARIDATGVSKTTVIINALAKYLAHHDDVGSQSAADDDRQALFEYRMMERFKALEARVKVLEEVNQLADDKRLVANPSPSRSKRTVTSRGTSKRKKPKTGNQKAA